MVRAADHSFVSMLLRGKYAGHYVPHMAYDPAHDTGATTYQYVLNSPKAKSIANALAGNGPTSYAPGMRRQDSILGPGGQSLGLGSPNEPAAPPVMSGAKHPGMSMKHLGQLAQAAIAAQYNPVLGALANQVGSTQSQAHKASRQVRRQGNRAVGDLASLYGNLGREAGQARRQSNRQYHQDIQGTRKSYHQLGHEVNTDYSTSMGSTAKELQRLGIDPSVALQGSARDQAFLNAQRATERQSTIGNMRQDKHDFARLLGQARRDIIATGAASIGQSQSATRSALSNIATNLADNLARINMQKAQVQGQMASATANQRAAMIQARQKNAGDRLDRKIKKAQLAKLLTQIPGMPGYVGNQQTGGRKDHIGQGLTAISTSGLPGAEQTSLANALQGVISGVTVGGKPQPFVTQNYGPIWNYLVAQGQKNKWTQADMNTLQSALQIALGM